VKGNGRATADARSEGCAEESSDSYSFVLGLTESNPKFSEAKHIAPLKCLAGNSAFSFTWPFSMLTVYSISRPAFLLQVLGLLLYESLKSRKLGTPDFSPGFLASLNQPVIQRLHFFSLEFRVGESHGKRAVRVLFIRRPAWQLPRKRAPRLRRAPPQSRRELPGEIAGLLRCSLARTTLDRLCGRSKMVAVSSRFLSGSILSPMFVILRVGLRKIAIAETLARRKFSGAVGIFFQHHFSRHWVSVGGRERPPPKYCSYSILSVRISRSIPLRSFVNSGHSRCRVPQEWEITRSQRKLPCCGGQRA